MRQKSTRVHDLGLAALLVTGTVFSTAAHAQSAIFNYNASDASGSHQYGVLNGTQVALYLNDRGDLGAPYPIINGNPGSKPPSIVDPATGRPLLGNIGSNGQILPQNNPPAYAALFSQTNTLGGTIGDSIRAKSEYLGAGSSSIIEGFSVYANDGLQGGTRFLRNSDMNVNNFSVTGGTGAGPLSAVSNLSADLFFNNTGDTGVLNIQQTISYQTGAGSPANRVQFSTTFTNNSSDALQNFRYARVVDANTGFSSPNTRQQFLTGADPNAFALTSSVGNNAVGIGVFGGRGPAPAPGSILFVADSSLGEGTLLQTPFDRANYYVELLANNAAVIKQKVGNDLITSDDTIVASTNNFIGDLAFRDQVGTLLNFGNSADQSLILLSPSLTIGAGQSADFTFFYFFGGQVNSSVPEPGTLALFATAGLSGMWLRRRKK